jgi:hypothetical protein
MQPSAPMYSLQQLHALSESIAHEHERIRKRLTTFDRLTDDSLRAWQRALDIESHVLGLPASTPVTSTALATTPPAPKRQKQKHLTATHLTASHAVGVAPTPVHVDDDRTETSLPSPLPNTSPTKKKSPLLTTTTNTVVVTGTSTSGSVGDTEDTGTSIKGYYITEPLAKDSRDHHYLWRRILHCFACAKGPIVSLEKLCDSFQTNVLTDTPVLSREDIVLYFATEVVEQNTTNRLCSRKKIGLKPIYQTQTQQKTWLLMRPTWCA